MLRGDNTRLTQALAQKQAELDQLNARRAEIDQALADAGSRPMRSSTPPQPGSGHRGTNRVQAEGVLAKAKAEGQACAPRPKPKANCCARTPSVRPPGCKARPRPRRLRCWQKPRRRQVS